MPWNLNMASLAGPLGQAARKKKASRRCCIPSTTFACPPLDRPESDACHLSLLALRATAAGSNAPAQPPSYSHFHPDPPATCPFARLATKDKHRLSGSTPDPASQRLIIPPMSDSQERSRCQAEWANNQWESMKTEVFLELMTEWRNCHRKDPQQAFNADCRLLEKILGLPCWESYSMTFLIQHLIATLCTTRHPLSMLLTMHIQLSFGLMSSAGLPHTAASRRATVVSHIP